MGHFAEKEKGSPDVLDDPEAIPPAGVLQVKRHLHVRVRTGGKRPVCNCQTQPQKSGLKLRLFITKTHKRSLFAPQTEPSLSVKHLPVDVFGGSSLNYISSSHGFSVFQGWMDARCHGGLNPRGQPVTAHVPRSQYPVLPTQKVHTMKPH